MTNAEKFQKVFGYYATDMWAKPEKEFLEWINAEALEQETVSRESYDHEFNLRKMFEMKVFELENKMAEQEQIIHCKDCKHWQEWENGIGDCLRSNSIWGTDYDDFCSFAEKERTMKIGDEVYVHGYIDEIRQDTIIIRNDGGYFGTVPSEITERDKIIYCKDCKFLRWYEDDEYYYCALEDRPIMGRKESRTMTNAEAVEIMTKQEAVEWFKLMKENFENTKYAEALDMAIKALEQQSPCDMCENEKKDWWEMCQFCPAEPKGSDEQ